MWMDLTLYCDVLTTISTGTNWTRHLPRNPQVTKSKELCCWFPNQKIVSKIWITLGGRLVFLENLDRSPEQTCRKLRWKRINVMLIKKFQLCSGGTKLNIHVVFEGFMKKKTDESDTCFIRRSLFCVFSFSWRSIGVICIKFVRQREYVIAVHDWIEWYLKMKTFYFVSHDYLHM